MFNIKKRNTVFMCCHIFFSRCWYYKDSCTNVVAEGIESLVLDKVFPWNYLLWPLLLKVLHYIEQIRAFHEKNYWTFGHIKVLHNLQSWPKYMRQTLVLVWNSALREKFNFNFWTVFRLYWQHFHFGRKTAH